VIGGSTEYCSLKSLPFIFLLKLKFKVKDEEVCHILLALQIEHMCGTRENYSQDCRSPECLGNHLREGGGIQIVKKNSL
jgi:hypothetical protein